jgi:outer membrane receptor protein involved in Fe transport
MKKSHLSSAFQFIFLFCCTTFFSADGFAQSGPNPSTGKVEPEKIRRDRRVNASPISVVNTEQLERTYSLSTTDLIQKIAYTPNHVVTNTTTTIRGFDNQNKNLVLVNNTQYGHVNNTRRMTYTRSSLADINNIPISAIEQINVLKGAPGIQYGSNATSGVVNFTLREDGNTRFPEGKYVPYYTPPKTDYSGTVNQLEADWSEVVEKVFAKGKYQITEPDDTYGGNDGSRYVSVFEVRDYLIENKDYIDENNTVRLSVETEYYPEGYASQETKYMDGCGEIEFSKLDLIDHFGNKFNQLNIRYEDNEPVNGYFQPDEEADLSFRAWLEKDELNDDLNMLLYGKYKNENAANFNYQQSTEPCEKESRSADNIISADISARLEDFGSGMKELFPGLNASYTKVYKPWIGATADASVNFGKVNDVNYTILAAHVGPTFLPFPNSHGLKDQITLTAHTLAGYTNVSQKFSSGSNSYGDFSLKLGIGGMYHLKDEWNIGLQISNNMVLAESNTASNWSIGIGIRYIY